MRRLDVRLRRIRGDQTQKRRRETQHEIASVTMSVAGARGVCRASVRALPSIGIKVRDDSSIVALTAPAGSESLV
jgi:hypothetical protein